MERHEGRLSALYEEIERMSRKEGTWEKNMSRLATRFTGALLLKRREVQLKKHRCSWPSAIASLINEGRNGRGVEPTANERRIEIGTPVSQWNAIRATVTRTGLGEQVGPTPAGYKSAYAATSRRENTK
jgi:hypothetical protein